MNPNRLIAPTVALLLGAGLWLQVRHSRTLYSVAEAPTLSPRYAPAVERTETHVLARGETLSDVLARASLGAADLADVLLGLREYLNPRRLTDGVEVTVRRLVKDDTPRSIEVRVNADTTVRLARGAWGWDGGIVETPIQVDTVFVSGTIGDGAGSLYESIVYSDDDEVPITDRSMLVYRLADVYEFQVDFNNEIQPGDTYRFVYERERRPDGTARSQRILAAELVNRSQVLPAVWYSEGGDLEGYYDLDGKPLATGFSRYPVDFRITSNFSNRRYHPVLGIYRGHYGTDFGAPSGTPVHATADGTVIFAGRNGSYGNLVKIRHMSGYETRYAHLRGFASGIRAGVRVKQKQVIGYVGMTGLATGVHLHYELRRNGQPINARTARLPTAPPLPADHMETYRALATRQMALLEDQTQRYLARRAGRGGKLADE
ncbi:MAG: M23 family metallopeptidase [Gemmatimonadota bacterium]|jgi:murein DD-endopeptidase MepM/ murein hydrolase activator NlpD